MNITLKGPSVPPKLEIDELHRMVETLCYWLLGITGVMFVKAVILAWAH